MSAFRGLERILDSPKKESQGLLGIFSVIFDRFPGESQLGVGYCKMDRSLRTWFNYPESTRNHHKLSAWDFERTSCTVGLRGRMCDDGLLGPREFTLVRVWHLIRSCNSEVGNATNPKTLDSSFHFVFPCPKTIPICRNIIHYNPFVMEMDSYVGYPNSKSSCLRGNERRKSFA